MLEPVKKSFTGGGPTNVHINRPLTNFAQKFLQEERYFIALQAIPNIPVQKRSDRYYIYPAGEFYRDEAQLRAPGTESAGTGWPMSDDTFYCDVWGIHKDISDQDDANQDSGAYGPLDLVADTNQFLAHKLLIRRERDFTSRFLVGNVWFNGTTAANAGNNVNWVTGTPISDIETAITLVHEITGYRPNNAIFGRKAFDVCKRNDEVLARITGGATGANPAMVNKQNMAALFELENLYISESVVNTGIKGAANAFTFVNASNVLLYYSRNNGVASGERASRMVPSAMVTFSWTGFLGTTNAGMRITDFQVDTTKSRRIEGEMAFDHKVTSPSLGYLFTSVDT